MSAVSNWIRNMKEHYFVSRKYGVSMYFKDVIACFLIRFGSPYEKFGEREFGHMQNAINSLMSNDSASRKYALEYLGLPKNMILIKDRRKNDCKS